MKTHSKAEWRRLLINSTPTPEQRETAQTQIHQNLKNWLQGSVGIWGAYWALPSEPDLDKFLKSATGVTWALPKVSGEKLEYWIPGSAAFELSSLKVREPVPAGDSKKIELGDLQGLLIPGVGFDRAGVRLGRGKGFYDKTFASFRGQKVGVAFSWQVVDQLPQEKHDLCVDVLVTEKEVIGFG